jgi:hypothetical protein
MKTKSTAAATEIASLRAEVKQLRAILADAVSFDDAVTRDDPEPENQQPEWLRDARAILRVRRQRARA